MNQTNFFSSNCNDVFSRNRFDKPSANANKKNKNCKKVSFNSLALSLTGSLSQSLLFHFLSSRYPLASLRSRLYPFWPQIINFSHSTAETICSRFLASIVFRKLLFGRLCRQSLSRHILWTNREMWLAVIFSDFFTFSKRVILRHKACFKITPKNFQVLLGLIGTKLFST